MEAPQGTCVCYHPPFHYSDYHISTLGTDDSYGNYAEVTLETCTHCRTHWLKYLIEQEGFTQSGRWFRGIVKEDQLAQISPSTAVAHLEALDWYIYGGSYFNTTGNFGHGKLIL